MWVYMCMNWVYPCRREGIDPLYLGRGNFVQKYQILGILVVPKSIFVKLSIGVAWLGAPTPEMALGDLHLPFDNKSSYLQGFSVLFSGEVVPLLLSGGC